ncbi:MAG TPA: indole-3-glycerol phosphate synthase TrpC [Terriglobales bacterium]|nr:indole-3-glycerol phosphate synthase TrpC [Terriglobales bacterium]
MPIGLQEIIAATRRHVERDRGRADVRALERQAESHVPRGFRRTLKDRSERGPAVIAELKKASPSRGLIRRELDPAALARELEQAGAAALSVLTDEEFFQGSLQNLRAASQATHLPCLRKDFMVDEFQLLEARAHHADAVLLIAAGLADAAMRRLADAARGLSLDVLCEVHDERELERAVAAGCDLIGVNNRDLRTFRVDLNTALRLAPQIPRDAVRVAESGLGHASDIAALREAGYDAFLVGESLMAAQHPGEALRELLSPSRTNVPSF